MKINISCCSQLQILLWNRKDTVELEDKEALSLYEANWRFIEPEKMTVEERMVLDQLIHTVGNGVLNV